MTNHEAVITLLGGVASETKYNSYDDKRLKGYTIEVVIAEIPKTDHINQKKRHG